MTERRGREFTRRDLFGIFGRTTRPLREAVAKAEGASASRATPVSYPRLLRPPTDTIVAVPDGQGGFLADLRGRPIAVGGSARIAAVGLAAPFIAVRVNPSHTALAAGACPVDGSDLVWNELEDRIACPSCGSRWRLDGEIGRGPAEHRLASFLVDETASLLRFRP